MYNKENWAMIRGGKITDPVLRAVKAVLEFIGITYLSPFLFWSVAHSTVIIVVSCLGKRTPIRRCHPTQQILKLNVSGSMTFLVLHKIYIARLRFITKLTI